MLRLKLLTILFGICISLGLILGFNYYCKLQIDKNGIVFKSTGAPLDASLLQYIVPGQLLTEIPVPEEDNSNLPSFGFTDSREKMGSIHEPGKSYRSAVKILDSNQYIYETVTSFDENNRRIVKQTHSDKNEVAILFIGCSLTYGEGVNDYETLVSRISENIVGANVYNLGIGGSTETQIYYEMNHGKEDFYKLFKEKKLIIINTFFDSHLVRQACDLSCYGYNQWILDKPKFELIPDSKLEFKGFFKEFYSINFFTKLIFESSIFLYYNFQQSSLYGEKNLDLTVEALHAIRDEYSKKYQVLDFYNYFHEYSDAITINRLAPKMVKKGFRPIIANKIYVHKNFNRKYMIPIDGHPNAVGHQIDAKTILWALQRDWPQLIKNKNKNVNAP